MLSQIAASLLKGAVLFLDAFSWLIVIQSALTVFTRPKGTGSKAANLLKRITEPVNSPFRRLLYKLGASRMPVDLSPMLSLSTLWILARILEYFAESFYHFTY